MLWLSLIVVAAASPQRAPFHDDKIDSYGNISFRHEKERLDWLAKVLGDVPDGLAYINVYAGRKSCLGEARTRALRAKRYLVRRWGVRADRIVWRDGGYQESLTIDLWVRPRGAPAPTITPTVDPKEARISGKCKR
jgi:hypothetical protein